MRAMAAADAKDGDKSHFDNYSGPVFQLVLRTKYMYLMDGGAL
jgi:hypothetical protein